MCWNFNFTVSHRCSANCSDIPTHFTAALSSLGFLNQKHLLWRSASMICSKPFQLWPREHELQTLCWIIVLCIAAVSFRALSDPSAPDFREESLSRAPQRYIPVAAAQGSQNQLMKLLPRGVVLFEKKETRHIRYLRFTVIKCLHDTWESLFISLWAASPCFLPSQKSVLGCVFSSAALIQRNLPRLSIFQHMEDDLPPFLKPWGVLSLAGSQSTMAGN